MLDLAETEETDGGILHRAWFLTLAFTGIRISELLDLRLSDLDFSTLRLFIHDAKNQEGRVCFLTPALVHHLQCYLAWRPDAE
ncbi:MAG: tyrosine-type recombinase/integrase [Caldilineaceae bacterium]|nr:tyrosine-type recombinase/integrase [Caldilineaceae bacterium]